MNLIVETLRAQVAERTKELVGLHAKYALIRTAAEANLNAAAISQAYAVKLQNLVRDIRTDCGKDEYINELLALPCDRSALDEMLKAERERCAKLCERYGLDGIPYANAIRSLT